MISLPPPDAFSGTPSEKPPEPVAVEPPTAVAEPPPEPAEPEEPEIAEEPQPAADAADAADADAAGAPDCVEDTPAEEATCAGSPEDTEASEAPKKKRAAYRALEIAEQVAQVQEWLTMGKRPNQIRALCAEHWGLQTRAAEQRMQDARRQMVVDVDVYVRKDKAAQMIQQLEQVLEQALQMRQGSNAIGALRLQADLLQLLSRHQ